jgi:hypothetical protein
MLRVVVWSHSAIIAAAQEPLWHGTVVNDRAVGAADPPSLCLSFQFSLCELESRTVECRVFLPGRGHVRGPGRWASPFTVLLCLCPYTHPVLLNDSLRDRKYGPGAYMAQVNGSQPPLLVFTDPPPPIPSVSMLL